MKTDEEIEQEALLVYPDWNERKYAELRMEGWIKGYKAAQQSNPEKENSKDIPQMSHDFYKRYFGDAYDKNDPREILIRENGWGDEDMSKAIDLAREGGLDYTYGADNPYYQFDNNTQDILKSLSPTKERMYTREEVWNMLWSFRNSIGNDRPSYEDMQEWLSKDLPT